jgi:adenylosuccinate synthase
VLLRELADLEAKGIRGYKLFISERAQVIMPYHLVLDGLEESAKGGMKAGTTKRGIGPAYSDKVARFGITMGDLLDPGLLKRKLEVALAVKRRLTAAYGQEQDFQFRKIYNSYIAMGRKLKKHIRNTSALLVLAIEQKKQVLMEGAQGTLLDPDHGTYPYVTSSNAVAGAAATGSGIGPRKLDWVVGVTKAYTTRVGEGPFPTELKDDIGDHIRNVGGEYGTTTGRPRRCGWLDLVALAHAVDVNGLDALAVTKLDVLGGLRRIKVAVAYDIGGEKVTAFPANIDRLSKAEPVYREFDGWEALKPAEWTAIAGRGLSHLPAAAQDYLEFVSGELGVPIELVSLGPSREATIDLREELREGPAQRP